MSLLTSLLIAASAIFYLLIPLSKKWRYVGCAALLITWLILLWPSLSLHHRLAKEGRSTTGTLLNKICTPKNAKLFEYKFQVEGKEFIGQGIPGEGNRDCDESRIGDQIFITYIVSDPTVSLPARKVNSEYLIALILSCCLFPFLIWGNKSQTIFWQERKARKKKSRETHAS